MNFIIDIYFQLTNFNFDPVAVNFGPIKITWYALSYIVGLLFAWRYALYISKVNYLLKEEVIDIKTFDVLVDNYRPKIGGQKFGGLNKRKKETRKNKSKRKKPKNKSTRKTKQ